MPIALLQSIVVSSRQAYDFLASCISAVTMRIRFVLLSEWRSTGARIRSNGLTICRDTVATANSPTTRYSAAFAARNLSDTRRSHRLTWRQLWSVRPTRSLCRPGNTWPLIVQGPRQRLSAEIRKLHGAGDMETLEESPFNLWSRRIECPTRRMRPLREFNAFRRRLSDGIVHCVWLGRHPFNVVQIRSSLSLRLSQNQAGPCWVAGMSTRPLTDMRHALALAERALGTTAPNPAVGCVIVKDDGRVVGRGWTQPGGRPHAEVDALAEAGEAARGATAYVTLEPCAHHGQTPPCANALIAAGVARVVAAVQDPDPRVVRQEASRCCGMRAFRLRPAFCEKEAGRTERRIFPAHDARTVRWSRSRSRRASTARPRPSPARANGSPAPRRAASVISCARRTTRSLIGDRNRARRRSRTHLPHRGPRGPFADPHRARHAPAPGRMVEAGANRAADSDACLHHRRGRREISRPAALRSSIRPRMRAAGPISVRC